MQLDHPTQRSDGFPVFYAATAVDWREWLRANHGRAKNVWLLLYKKDSDVPSISYPEARDEALCYGWVDSKPNKRNAKSYYLFFAARDPKSNWSRVNKQRVAELTAADRMRPAGLAMVEEAKRRGTWDALNDVENLVVPPDLAAAFAAVGGKTRANWEAFPPSTRRGILEWIFNAKRAGTRVRRIKETAELAKLNVRANQFR